jgi:PKD repeat protein
MSNGKSRQRLWGISLMLLLLLILSACNLGAAPEAEATLTVLASTGTPDPNATRTTQPQGGVTVFPTLTPFVFSTRPVVVPTTIVLVPNQPVYPTATPAPINILIVSPLSGSIVSGSVNVFGSASHPNFLQYRLEFGPEPNPNNLWYALTGVVQQQVYSGVLGVWPTNTGVTPDGYYQLRLRVFLRDGTQLTTQVGGIRVQNNRPTPVPTNTTVPSPIAAFTQDFTTGVAPLVVRFTDRSQGQIASYAWSFGDGGSSNSRNPTYTFRRGGTYTVTLRVTGPGGQSNVSRQIVVTSPSAPTASFTPSATSGQAPLAVTFTNTSQGQISSYEWDFGDNSPLSNVASPSHTFTTVGTYNVILRVTGAGGSSTMVQQITVSNPSIPAPVAIFEPNPAAVETGDSVTFNNTSTGQVNSFWWDFNGDGITDNTDISPTHIYPAAGTYTVRLIAVGPGGQNATTRQVVVSNPPNAPTAGFTAAPLSGTAPLTVNFTNATTGDVSSYAWDFDGNAVIDSTEQNPSHTFQDAGTYTVTLMATGPGGSTLARATISVENPPQPPSADFTFNPNGGEAPVQVQFTNASTGSGLTYAWDFDGDSVVDSTEENPTHNFTTAGTFNVSLAVRDPQNQSDSTSKSITITAPVVQAPVANFSLAPSNGSAPLVVTFTNESTGDISSYAWDFTTDGTVDATTANASNTYNTAGTFTVTLTVTGAGGSNSATRTVTVAEALQAPVASFTSPATGTVNTAVQFNSTSQGQVDSYAWDFGDGNTSTEANPSHTYDTAGQYTVTLTVTNAAGSDTETATIDVQEALQAPVAGFSAVSPATVNTAVQFTNTSQGQVDSYAWDFGDGGTSTDANPSHTFATTGQFTVTLTVSNAAGSDTETATIDVQEALQAPAAGISAPTSATVNTPVQFTNSSQGQIDTYIWDFGDGNTSTDANPTHTFATTGQFTVTLTVSNAAGSDSETATIEIEEALQAPAAGISAPPTATVNTEVLFSSTSQGQVDSYAWDFGDGNTSTDANPTHTFATTGQFTVTLTVSNAAGSDSETATIDIQEALQAPVAGFSAPSPVTVNTPVQFTNSSQGQIDTYIWDFGDGNTSTDANPTHTFATTGQFTVALTVTNAAGTDTESATIDVQAPLQAPVASFSVPSPVTVDTEVQFSSTLQGQVDSYVWDFGDGGTSTDANPIHTYTSTGQFTVSLTVTNNAGSDSETATIDVQEALQAPVASLDVPATATVNTEVQFTSTTQGQVDSYTWDFGDGNSSTDANPSHTFATTGQFTVTLTVTNAAGTDTETASIDVQAAVELPVAGISAPPTATVNTEVSFSSTSQGQIDTYIWDFGDGNSSTDANPTHTFASTGQFTVALTVSNAAGTDTETVTIDVQAAIEAPVASFSAPTTATVNTDVPFASTSQGQVDSYAWDFGDGGTSTDANPVHQFAAAGQYTVTLTVTNVAGSDSETVVIDVQAPVQQVNITGEFAFVTNRDGNNEIYVVNADGSNPVNVSSNGADDTDPAWSPDGTRLAFTSNRQGDFDLHILNISDGTVTQITFDSTDDTQPRWSPDGSRLAYTRTSGGNSDIYFVNLSDNSISPWLATDANESYPTWSPDGSQLAYESGQEIFVANVNDTSTAINITNDAGNDTQPSWGADNLIAFASNRDGDFEIHVMGTDGSNVQKLTDNNVADGFPNWVPNGNRIVYTSELATDGSGSASNLNIYTMRADGSEQAPYTTDGSSESRGVRR